MYLNLSKLFARSNLPPLFFGHFVKRNNLYVSDMILYFIDSKLLNHKNTILRQIEKQINER